MLNTENDTVDLRTGRLRPHRPEELLSKMIPLRYDQHAECPQFMAFLFRIMGGHPDASEGENIKADQTVSYLQKAFGCAATGKPEKLLLVLYGEGSPTARRRGLRLSVRRWGTRNTLVPVSGR
jgi:putative DNA primase/helicase